jgi:C4-type Zn-finger protein
VNRVSVNECPQCGGEIIAPEWSERLSAHCTRNAWVCDACGYRYEDTVYLPARELANVD